MSATITKKTLKDPKMMEFALKFLNKALERSASLVRARKNDWYDGEMWSLTEDCESMLEELYTKFRENTNNEYPVVVSVRYKDCRTGNDYNPSLCSKCYKDSISGGKVYLYADSAPVSEWKCKCSDTTTEECITPKTK